MTTDEHNAQGDASSYRVNVSGDARVAAIGDNNTVVVPRREVTWPVVVGSAPLLASAYRHRPVLRAEVLAHNAVVLSGDGGTGKSQLAAGVFSSSVADIRLWVAAGSRTSIVTGYANAAARLDLGGPGDDPEILAQTLVEYLAASTKPWLVVLDDVWHPPDADEFWPSGGGTVVATTRRRDAALSGGGRRIVDVGVLSPDDAYAYLFDRLSPALPGLPAGALDKGRELSADLGQLPLGLAQAAAVIIDEAITCATYRSWFADRTTSLDELFPPTAIADGYDRTIATTWVLAVETANRLEPAGMAMPLAQLISVFDPAGIPESVFTNDRACELLASATGRRIVSPQDARKALRVLHRVSLVSHNPSEGDPRSVRMHGLTGRAIREYVPKTLHQSLVVLAADCLSDAWPEIENDPPLADSFRTNATTLSDAEPGAMWHLSAGGHRILQLRSHSLLDAGLIGAAIADAEALSAQAHSILGPDHPDTLSVRGHLGRAYLAAGLHARALPLFEEYLAAVTQVFGPTHPQLLDAQNGLASAKKAAGDQTGAIELYQQSLTVAEQVLGPDHPDTIMTRHNLGSALGQAGEPARAIPILERALADAERILGSGNPAALNARNALANAYLVGGLVSRAIQLLEANVADSKRILGLDHPDTLMARDNLASAHLRAGDADRAVSLHEVAAADYQRVLGPEHPDTLISRINLAGAQIEAGASGVAVINLEHLLADCERVLGSDHPVAIQARDALIWARGNLQ